jgi:hypothetical protein
VNIFNPSRDDVRRYYCGIWRKHAEGTPLIAEEALALKWIVAHPQFHDLLADEPRALAEEYSVERGQINPFLHLSLHVALDEQLSIDQPRGIVALFRRLAARADDEHEAAHRAMGCLADIIWRLQHGELVADPAEVNAAYLDCLRRQAGK